MSVWKVRHKPMSGLMAKLNEQGYNLHSFSVQVGIPYMNVFRWAKGVAEPSLDDAKRMADFLGCTINDLLGE